MASGDEEEPGGAEKPQATAPHRHARQPFEPIDERRLPFGAAVAIGIFEHRHPVAEAEISLEWLLGVGEVFGDEHPAGCIDAGSDRIADHRFSGKKIDSGGEPRLDRRKRRLRRKWLAGPLGVFRGRLRLGGRAGGHRGEQAGEQLGEEGANAAPAPAASGPPTRSMNGEKHTAGPRSTGPRRPVQECGQERIRIRSIPCCSRNYGRDSSCRCGR